MKVLKLLFMLCVLFSLSICFIESDRSFILREFEKRKWQFTEHWNKITPEFFDQYFKADIFTRVSEVDEFLGFDTFGFVFRCKYWMPRNGKSYTAALKFIPEYAMAYQYYANQVWIRALGTPMPNLFNEQITYPYSFNDDLWIIQGNFVEPVEEWLQYIAQFYEMQFIHGNVGRRIENMTIVITAAGEQSLSSQMFEDPNDNGEEANTQEFLRIYYELCVGVANVNARALLHGDIRPENAVLEVHEDGTRHPLITSFDQSAGFCGHFTGYDPFLRYRRDYRAPSIKNKALGRVISADFTDAPNPNSVFLYKYTPDFREDTFALEVSFKTMVTINQSKIRKTNRRIQNIQALIEILISKEPFDMRLVPSTKIWAQIVKEVMDSSDEGNHVVSSYMGAVPTVQSVHHAQVHQQSDNEDESGDEDELTLLIPNRGAGTGTGGAQGKTKPTTRKGKSKSQEKKHSSIQLKSLLRNLI